MQVWTRHAGSEQSRDRIGSVQQFAYRLAMNVRDVGPGVPRRRLPWPRGEHLRDSFWFAPTAAMAAVFVLWLAASELDAAIVEALKRDGDLEMLADLQRFADDAKSVVSAVSSAMMTFIGVVFSISLVAVQMASGQFTPRVVRLFVRSRITKATFAVFLATFVLTLLVLTSYDSAPNPSAVTSVPFVQAFLTVLMVGLSLLLFVLYVNTTLRLMRISHVIARIARESLRSFSSIPGPLMDPSPTPQAPPTAWIRHDGPAGVLQEVHTDRLVRAARKHDVVLRLIPRMGDFLVPGTPVLAVYGKPFPVSQGLRHTVSTGVERTFHQDISFGLRQLSDIALRAMSSAINDPTTAVQALDRVVQLLSTLSQWPLNTACYRDSAGAVRLIRSVPSWTELVDLGLAEVRGCAVGSPQVSRRMLAGIEDLLSTAPQDRHAPLLRHRELLQQSVALGTPTAADRAFALKPDRQGIG